MWEFILFLRDCFADISSLLNSVLFEFAGMSVSLLELFIGFVALGFIISVFWKGART